MEIVAINVLAQFPLEMWQGYLQKIGLFNAIYAQDTTQEAIRAFHVRTPGTTIILNKKGEEVYRDGSATSYETLKIAVAMSL